MKKSEIVLLWVAGLWAVLCLLVIADAGRWASGLALILAGWLVCGLVWLSINKWPKSDDGPGIVTKCLASMKRVTTRFPSVVVSVLGYVFALVFLLGWLNARAQIAKERNNVAEVLSYISNGQLNIFDCVALPTALTHNCMLHLNGKAVPKDDLALDPQPIPGGFVPDKR